MRYDVDLQEMGAIRRAKSMYGRKCQLVEGNEKKNLGRPKEEEEEERVYAGDYYATDATSESCLS